MKIMKKFNIVATGYEMNAEINCSTFEQAMEHFADFANNPSYEKAYLSDNFTGELYAYFYKTVEGNSIKLELWSVE